MVVHIENYTKGYALHTLVNVCYNTKPSMYNYLRVLDKGSFYSNPDIIARCPYYIAVTWVQLVCLISPSSA